MTWGPKAGSSDQLEGFLSNAPGLLRDLSCMRPLGRTLIFVAQDEGGLLVTEALRLSEKGESESEKGLIRWTSAVVFLVSRRSVGRDGMSFDNQIRPDAGSFPQLQRDYCIHANYFLESSALEFRDPEVRSQLHQMDASTLPATFATSSNALSIVERISASPQGLCRFKSFLDIGYVRLAEALRLHTDRVKDMGLHSREALSGVAPRPLNYLTWSEWSFGPGGRNLLWIKGKPGSGKSTLLKKTLRRLEAAGLPSSVLVASFFFTARSNVKLQNSALGLFQAILYTLLTEDKALLSAFIPVYRRKCAAHEGRRKWQEEELRAFFKSAYSGEYPGIKNAVGVIDALDEVRSESYDEAYRVAQDFVSFFKDLTEKGKLKVCLSSRHFPNFQVADCDQIVVEDFNKDDIVRFVNGKFPNPQNPARANRLAERVAEQANGVFIWVTVVVGRLKSGLDNGMTDPGLERVLEELPSELEKLFEGVLDSAMSRAKMRKAEEIFQWVLLSQRPLEKDELQHILTISRHQDDGSAATTASIEHWSTSKDCLNGDPEKFLMQLRLHTRGLAEVVLLRESSEYEESLESLEEALWQDTDDYEDPMVSGYGIKAPWRNEYTVPAKRRRTVGNTGSERQ
ncbi:hypothetical protein CGRA01v4_06841 [Colletotrichum graminicola]|nr:hypothetical protein CGRA01v4_06841 [Colletotrichum graminicola]